MNILKKISAHGSYQALPADVIKLLHSHGPNLTLSFTEGGVWITPAEPQKKEAQVDLGGTWIRITDESYRRLKSTRKVLRSGLQPQLSASISARTLSLPATLDWLIEDHGLWRVAQRGLVDDEFGCGAANASTLARAVTVVESG